MFEKKNLRFFFGKGIIEKIDKGFRLVYELSYLGEIFFFIFLLIGGINKKKKKKFQ
jgi:hypothetical protein